MRKVNRPVTPASLQINGNIWTQELLAAIQQLGEFSKVPSTLKNKYNQTDIKATLEVMYKGKCCYCEDMFDTTSYGHIEHLKPKAHPDFHHLTYEWNNLHLSCQKCNTAKSNKWDFQNPIIDPSAEDPSQFLGFNPVTGEVLHKSERGQTTIVHTNLNRLSLIKSRQRVANRVLETILRLKSTPSSEDEKYYKDRLLEDTSDEMAFSSLIEMLAREYL